MGVEYVHNGKTEMAHASHEVIVNLHHFADMVLDYLKATNAKAKYAGRNPSASTATGLMSRHLKELKDFLEEALG